MQRVYTKFRRWNQQGLWQQIHLALAKEADLERCFVDSTTVVVHQQGAGCKMGQEFQEIGQSVGGKTTKIHMACDGLGNP
jgi:transposase